MPSCDEADMTVDYEEGVWTEGIRRVIAILLRADVMAESGRRLAHPPLFCLFHHHDTHQSQQISPARLIVYRFEYFVLCVRCGSHSAK